VVVIGGGMIGASVAFRLARSGLKVVVFDRGEPGAEASSAAAGMLAPQGETAEPDAFFELCAASRDLYPPFVAEIEEASGQSVGYRRDGTVLVATDEEESQELDKIYQAQRRHGLSLERLTAEDVRRRVAGLSPQIQRGLFIPGDHWVDNERLTQAVIEAGRRLGVVFRSHSFVRKLNLRDGRVESVEVGDSSSGAGSTQAAGRFILAAGC
jgi:glycine oxidase